MSIRELVFFLLYDPVLLPTISAYFASLLGKTITYSWQQRKLTFNQIMKDGGMPSSHTAFVTGLTTAVYLTEGASTVFWVTAAFATIVIHDAMGLRAVTGRQSKAINEITTALRLGKEITVHNLKEVLGHTRLQVAAGLVIGFVVSYAVYISVF